MIRIALILSSLLLYAPVMAENFTSKIDLAVNKSLPNATVSILIKDAKNGRLLFSRNANKLLAPASSMKLFTAAAALYFWQPNHYFDTTLLQDKNNFYMKFGGSPSLTSNNLSQLLDYLKTQNIKTIQGDLVLDTSLFKPPYYPSGVSYDDLGWYYAAPDTAVNLDNNSIPYVLTPAKTVGKLVKIIPKGQRSIKIVNEVFTADKKNKDFCSLNIQIAPENTLKLSGCVTQDSNPKALDFALTDPEYSAKQLIGTWLKQNKITLKGKLVSGLTPKNASLLFTLHSNPLISLVNHMLKESDNLYADNLSKQLALAITHQANGIQAAFALKKVLSQHTHLDFSQLEIADGLGTRYNLATAEQLSVLLSDIYQNKTLYHLILQSLPQSGVSGSLKDRMKATPLEKIVYAKTGTMHDCSSLSGYLINPIGKPIIFSIIINGINKPIAQAKRLEEEILTIVNEEINGDTPEHSNYA